MSLPTVISPVVDFKSACIAAVTRHAAFIVYRVRVMKSIPGIGVLALVGLSFNSSALANIKDEFQRAQDCDFFKAEYVSDVGVYKDSKVRFCISDDQQELIYVMAMGTSWVVPLNRQYRSRGILSLNTLEENRLVLYQKEDGVVTRKVLGRKRGS